MQSQMTFDLLIIGLDDFLHTKNKYPYSPLLQRACHSLAATLHPYPKTMHGLLRLMEQPLKTWWPAELPDGYDADFGLISENELAEEATRYCYEILPERDVKQGEQGLQEDAKEPRQSAVQEAERLAAKRGLRQQGPRGLCPIAVLPH